LEAHVRLKELLGDGDGREEYRKELPKKAVQLTKRDSKREGVMEGVG